MEEYFVVLIFCCCVPLSVSSKETMRSQPRYEMPSSLFAGMMPPFPPLPFPDYPFPMPPLEGYPPAPPQSPEGYSGGFDTSRYNYDATGSLAREVLKEVHVTEEEFLNTHRYFMLESPTAKAIAEYLGKVGQAKEQGGDQCVANGEETDINKYRALHAEVVWNCESGWKRNETVVKATKSLLEAIDALDKQASEGLKDCKQGQPCYGQFKQTTLAASIDKQLQALSTNQLIDLKVLAVQDSVNSMYRLYKCVADNSDSVREKIYTDIAKINVCLSNVGLVTPMA
ncbi:uncharacterized protein LOC128982943 [Macrosteles quadrilineatus]|uniref:uncharacterized protein LOC128982943 n=1 Tax=Macrosteles quadrilineatus TaxID=74068 RepID=UPI0023E23350|nr:uncharacterized protein LOC128982943 [Macrosteles quadrilineatus]